MAQTGEVDVVSVRLSMNNVDAVKFDDDVIDQKLTEAEAIITHQLDDDDISDLDQGVFDLAVTALAKWRVWMSSPQEVRRGALDLNVTYDVQSYTNRLRDERNHALSLIGITRDGASSPIADKTDGVWHREV